jgi:hypothetical protein
MRTRFLKWIELASYPSNKTQDHRQRPRAARDRKLEGLTTRKLRIRAGHN